MWHSNHDKTYALFKNVIKGSKVEFKDTPIELKINGNDPYDLLDMLKIFGNWFKGIQESNWALVLISLVIQPTVLHAA